MSQDENKKTNKDELEENEVVEDAVKTEDVAEEKVEEKAPDGGDAGNSEDSEESEEGESGNPSEGSAENETGEAREASENNETVEASESNEPNENSEGGEDNEDGDDGEDVEEELVEENISEELEGVEEVKKDEERIPDFGVGDTIRVSYKIIEGDKVRTQPYQGIVIAKKGSGASKTFTVRKIGADNIGVERIFPFQSPNIEKVKVMKRGKVRRAKLYYLRDRVGRKATKIKEKVVQPTK